MPPPDPVGRILFENSNGQNVINMGWNSNGKRFAAVLEYDPIVYLYTMHPSNLVRGTVAIAFAVVVSHT